ncbi:MAG: replication-associated recombination protein A [Bacteroidetes bacterium]|uniref:Replication-associated recombination protein A n=1 Tax=Phaeocystidibacter marisrubri TaxID=1577780 RepID=A0A6L3ZJA2_9FLAO|nr:replication-associated recombination protein A [Phaeocystidibacter marisrubri]KAB2817699.1 replication-associated recombination protein A [Phaeocystidibacter marisrubri]TNE29244.1 MAG: replication-associated recombination protein A [Bacteroidota bacterium]
MTSHTPLAERMRPQDIDNYVGQKHLVGKGGALRPALERKVLPSMILWGPPGVGKTTLAFLLARTADVGFHTLSAVSAGVKDVREVIQSAEKATMFRTTPPVLFIDEIHRFSKSQQDALLGAVERGTITLIGATTENPSFEVIPALLSRTQLYVLNSLSEDELIEIVQQAIEKDVELSKKSIQLESTKALLRYSGGDARKLLNQLEWLVERESSSKVVINDAYVESTLQQRGARYDKAGEQHYDIISAFIKSIRGSDPNGAVYWLGRMIEGGEDPKFIARRLLISASEDIGLANPTALIMATNTFMAVERIGMPEGRIPLSQCAIYLATSPKSNASYMAINKVLSEIKQSGDLSVPLHLRNAPTKTMKDLGYGAGYNYSHDNPGNFADQAYLPDELDGTRFFEPGESEREKQLRLFMERRWKKRYGY